MGSRAATFASIVAGWFERAFSAGESRRDSGVLPARDASEGILPMSTHAPSDPGRPLTGFLTRTPHGTWLPG